MRGFQVNQFENMEDNSLKAFNNLFGLSINGNDTDEVEILGVIEGDYRVFSVAGRRYKVRSQNDLTDPNSVPNKLVYYLYMGDTFLASANTLNGLERATGRSLVSLRSDLKNPMKYGYVIKEKYE